ncbi:MAG: hypothetical protein JW727_01150 [Candidatus Aenigmarchaeota archaeon]|nr:hypothetical protein [Candidatus Aenigmarchaeota archaeon]
MAKEASPVSETSHPDWSGLQLNLEKGYSGGSNGAYRHSVSMHEYLNRTLGQEVADKLYAVKDRLGMEVDEGIMPLVGALWKSGYSTQASCEGHSDRGRKYPWVDVSAEGDIEKLKQIVEAYNKTHDLKWQVVPLFYSGEGSEKKVCTYQLKPVTGQVRTFQELFELRPSDFSEEERKKLEDSNYKVPEGIYNPLPEEKLPEAVQSAVDLAQFILDAEEQKQ